MDAIAHPTTAISELALEARRRWCGPLRLQKWHRSVDLLGIFHMHVEYRHQRSRLLQDGQVRFLHVMH
jgi:hypothetical protein